MKTDDLIRAIAADAKPPPNARMVLLRLLPLAVLMTAMVMGATVGLRPDAINAIGATAMKLSITLSLAAMALAMLSTRLMQLYPVGKMAALMIVPVMAAVFVAIDLLSNGAAGAMTRLVGTKASHCLLLIPAFSILPLAALLFAGRQGMPASPARARALAGLAAAGIGASIYALNCMEDSPLFVACWYSIAVLIVTAAGAAFGSRLLRW